MPPSPTPDDFRRALEEIPPALQPPEAGSPGAVLLDAARRHFAARGFDGARTRAIAEEAGVNLALLHYYFGSKEELYRRVLAGEILATFRSLGIDLAWHGQLRDVRWLERLALAQAAERMGVA